MESNICGTSVALGNFDGFHLGHMAVMSNTLKACRNNLTAYVLHFDVNPTEFLTGKLPPKLMSEAERNAFVEKLGFLQYTVKFSDIRSMSAEQFVEDILVKALNAKAVCCGFNFRFGVNASGDCNVLKKICNNNKINCFISPPAMYMGEPISSTRIREAISSGNVGCANDMLGRAYSISGTIVNGAKLGRQLGFPTINQNIDSSKAVPLFGVYETEVLLKGRIYTGMTNIGIKPTFGGLDACAETHILNFNDDVYGENAEIRLKKFIRPEIAFTSIEDLKKQVLADIADIKNGD